MNNPTDGQNSQQSVPDDPATGSMSQIYFTRDMAVVLKHSYIVVTNKDWHMTFTSDLFTKDSGFLPSEMKGRDFSIAIIRDNGQETFDEICRVLANGDTWEGELQARRKTGVMGYSNAKILPVVNENGEIRFVFSFHEITELKEKERRLQEERDYANALLDAIPGVFYQVDSERRLLRWNKVVESISGFTAEQLKNKDILDFYRPEKREEVLRDFAALFSGKKDGFENVIVTKSGEHVNYFLTGVQFEHEGEHQFMGIGIDITGLKIAEAELHKESALLQSLIESVEQGILMVGLDGSKIYQSRKFSELFQLPQEFIDDEDDTDQFNYTMERLRSSKLSAETLESVRHDPSAVLNNEVELADGTILAIFTAPVTGDDHTVYGRIWAAQDITERRRSEERIRFLASYDELTGLANRNEIREQISSCIKAAEYEARQFALLFLNLDHFKQINDGYGHSFGDSVITEVGEILKSVLGPESVVSRYGGDEFLILVRRITSEQHLEDITESILQNLKRWMKVNGREVFLSATIGLAVFPEHANSTETLIQRAGLALAKAKETARGSVIRYSAELTEESQQRTRLEHSLRIAVDESRFRLVYQPKVSIQTGKIIGCEALIRWIDPEMGELSPGIFIPMSEQNGLIVPMSDWVLREAAGQSKVWYESGYRVPVSVNLSSRQFLQQDVQQWVIDVLDEVQLPADLLELELTEGALVENPETVVRVFARLSEVGVKIAIDDFGSGYSSLKYLKDFQIDTLKIDRSFISNMLSSEKDASIVKTVINLAHALGYRALAEGVESEEELEFLKSLGCDEFQGYYYSRPIPAEEFEALLIAQGQ